MNHGKKRCLIIISILAIPICVFICLKLEKRNETGFLTVAPGNNELFFEKTDLRVPGWDKDGTTYFFIPSFVDLSSIEQIGSDTKIFLLDGTVLSDPKPGKVQDVLVKSPAGDETPWKICFMKSDNIYTMYISLDSVMYEEIDHDEYTGAAIEVYSPNGKRNYYADDALIKGRGNTTWYNEEAGKKPYQIKLDEAASLCGMKKSDKWALLANRVDLTKMKNKLIYDLASEIGMEYAIESDWIDLYIDNEYMGNYLICHEPGIGKNDLDLFNLGNYNYTALHVKDHIETDDMKAFIYDKEGIYDGGYLVEKQISMHYEHKPCGFTMGKDFFSIKSPDNASLDQVSYISGFIDSIDSTINNGNGIEDAVDFHSFARRYLLEEISQNPDAALTSYYFYKKPKENILYAGPSWDFDTAFGEYFDDYTQSILELSRREENSGLSPLDWDEKLLEYPPYAEYFTNILADNISFLKRELPEMLEAYYKKIEPSVSMDYIRWDRESYYDSFESNYKYLAFFIKKRLENLGLRYGLTVDGIDRIDMRDKRMHTISFIYADGEVQTLNVADGEQLAAEELPELESGVYDSWKQDKEDDMMFSVFKPVYEDMVLIPNQSD